MTISLNPRKQNREGAILAERLRALRTQLGETQAEFAARLNIRPSTYARWELWGPPNTPVHRTYTKIMLNQLGRRKNGKNLQRKMDSGRRCEGG